MTETRAPSDPFGLLTPESRRDPYPAYARVRAAEPVHYSEAWGAWMITRHADCVQAFRHPELSANRAGGYAKSLPPEVRERLRPLLQNLSRWLLLIDPPAHTRIRAIVREAFTPRLVAAMRPRIERIAESLIDDLATRDEFDLIRDFAAPLPVIVIAEMLGLPPEDGLKLKSWSDALAAFMGASAIKPELVAGALRSVVELEAYFKEAIARRRGELGDDLMSTLLRASEGEEQLDEQELLSTCTVLLFGGHETTTNLIGNAVHVLLQRPDHAARVREAPDEQAPRVVDEVLRYESPVQRMGRVARGDFELAGATLRGGDRVFMVLGAANRDPEVFERPDVFDPDRRDDAKHLSFGIGPHFCLGAALGLLEGRVALTSLLRRLPQLSRAGDGAPAWIDNLTVRGLASLPLRP